MSQHQKHRSKTRVTGYEFDGDFDENEAERVLKKAEQDGTVTQFDTGRGRHVWFNGYPGAALRSVRDAVKAIVDLGRPRCPCGCGR